MAKGNTNPKVDFFFNKESKWYNEYNKLRSIVLDCGLDEELKWGQPCYVLGNKNIVLIHGFKEYCALLFFKGSLLQDTEGILIQQTENVQVPRQVRFTNAKEIVKLKTTLKAYIFQAIEIERSGVKPELKKTREFTMPVEFRAKLDKNPKLKKSF